MSLLSSLAFALLSMPVPLALLVLAIAAFARELPRIAVLLGSAAALSFLQITLGLARSYGVMSLVDLFGPNVQMAFAALNFVSTGFEIVFWSLLLSAALIGRGPLFPEEE